MPVTTQGLRVEDISGAVFVDIVAADLQILATGISPVKGGEASFRATRSSKDMVDVILHLADQEERMMERNGRHYTAAERARRHDTLKIFASRLVANLVEGFNLPWQQIPNSAEAAEIGDEND